MSDTDDGFDREAARRELREKYEDEREDREQTARMSELLLQGATMTNKHCDRCGSPIFRYEGQEFCPSCQHEAQQAQQSQQGDEPATDQAEAQSESPVAEPEPESPTADSESEVTTSATDAANTDAHATRDAGRRAPPSQTDTEQPTSSTPSAGQSSASGRTQPASDAEAALESSISALARRAASADDPRTATEYLEAAREAAEALAALRHNA